MHTTRDYVTTKTTDTVHLMSQHPVAERTLCGQRVAIATHVWGDETVSGIAATCERCRTVAGVDGGTDSTMPECTVEQQHRFDYLSYADELGGGLTDADLDQGYFAEVRVEAQALGLPWPPPADVDDAARLWDERIALADTQP